MRSLAFVLLLLSACGKGDKPPEPTTGSPNAQPESGPGQATRPRAPRGAEPSQAEKMYATMCAMCHGPDGKGTGPAAQTLTPKPRDYTDAQWQASVTDDQLKEVILKGGAVLGKSGAMPPWPQLAEQPEVLDGLVKIIRGFGKQP